MWPVAVHRSPMLTIFWIAAAGLCRLENRREAVPATKHQRFWPRIPELPKGLAMLIRSDWYRVRGGAAPPADAPAIPAASLPTRPLGGLLLLICP